VRAEPSRSGASLLEIYDRALPQVYGYLVSRCGEASLAEDLTSETFLAAAGQGLQPVSVAWLIGVARHKLADHWRRLSREDRLLGAVDAVSEDSHDPWESHFDALWARQVLGELAPQHRAALVLRYLDGLGVAEVATIMGRTVEATEALLVRARRELRRAYGKGGVHV
jgi:RNA polymerase sigma-70 factor, ECF subfamily